ncbi:MAG: hypothetical protein ACRCYS_18675 [Beijerinckiaceae bacterium]
MNLSDLIAEEEARIVAEARVEMAAEKDAWDALTDEQRAAHIAAVEAKFANVPDGDEDECCEECGEMEVDCECDT